MLMLNVGKVSLLDSASLLSPNNTLFSLTAPLSTFGTKNLSFLPYSYPQRTHLFFRRRNPRLCLLGAVNKRRRKGGTGLMDMDVSDFYDDEDDDDDDEEGMLLPFEEMKRWLENKPRGFGEGKVYDTSVEDKLLEEMEQSRRSQIANINKLENNPVNTKDHAKSKAPEIVPTAVSIRLVNLPKKKNIHRDLKSAFEGFPGIINISPAVSGNKKTKDPICKGFAFVDFKSEKDATRFVQIFSKQIISFGKVQKQIKCERMNSNSSKSVDEHSVDSSYNDPEPEVYGLEDDSDANFLEDDDSSDSWIEAASDVSGPHDELDLVKFEDNQENLELVSVSRLNGGDTRKQVCKSATESSSSNQRKKIQTPGKKLIAKGEVQKITKLDVPGPAKRLRVKEKAVLTDVFSKYAVKAALTCKEES